MIHYKYHGEHPTHGGAQVAAACFAILIPAMLLLPLVRMGYDGNGSGSQTLFVLHPDGVLNIFAVILLFVPIVGIAVEMMQRPSWDITAIVLAVIGALMVPLSIVTASHAAQGALGSGASVRPAMGAYALFTGYVVLALVVAFESWRLRRHRSRYTRDEPTGVTTV